MNCYLSATVKNLRQSVLVIGYGSSLHCDDGVGQRIAKEISGWGMPNVGAIAIHQLTPDLVGQLAEVDRVIFVDVSPAPIDQDIQIQPLDFNASDVTTEQWCEAQVLLAMTQTLYGFHPQAWRVTVAGINFEPGDRLSKVAERGIEAALEEIEYLLRAARTEPYL